MEWNIEQLIIIVTFTYLNQPNLIDFIECDRENLIKFLVQLNDMN